MIPDAFEAAMVKRALACQAENALDVDRLRAQLRQAVEIVARQHHEIRALKAKLRKPFLLQSHQEIEAAS